MTIDVYIPFCRWANWGITRCVVFSPTTLGKELWNRIRIKWREVYFGPKGLMFNSIIAEGLLRCHCPYELALGTSHNEDGETQPPLILVPVALKSPSLWSCPPRNSGWGVRCGFDPSWVAETYIQDLQCWASHPKVREQLLHSSSDLVQLNRAKPKGGPPEFPGSQVVPIHSPPPLVRLMCWFTSSPFSGCSAHSFGNRQQMEEKALHLAQLQRFWWECLY